MEGEGDRNDGQDIALGPMKKAHVKNWVFSDGGCDRIKVWRVLGGGSWRSQLVSSHPMHQLTVVNGPVWPISAPAPTRRVYNYWGKDRIAWSCLAPNDGSCSADKV